MIEIIYTTSSIVAIIAGLITSVAVGIQWWSGDVLSKQQEQKIAAMETDARIHKSTIVFQKPIALNVQNSDGLFVQKYAVSINSPIVHIPLYSYIKQVPNLKGPVVRVGDMQLNDVGGGVRQVEGVNISYIDTEYTVFTNRALEDGEGITFSLDQASSSQ